MLSAAESAGYDEIFWHDPEGNGYYQPIVTARNR